MLIRIKELCKTFRNFILPVVGSISAVIVSAALINFLTTGKEEGVSNVITACSIVLAFITFPNTLHDIQHRNLSRGLILYDCTLTAYIVISATCGIIFLFDCIAKVLVNTTIEAGAGLNLAHILFSPGFSILGFFFSFINTILTKPITSLDKEAALNREITGSDTGSDSATNKSSNSSCENTSTDSVVKIGISITIDTNKS